MVEYQGALEGTGLDINRSNLRQSEKLAACHEAQPGGES